MFAIKRRRLTPITQPGQPGIEPTLREVEHIMPETGLTLTSIAALLNGLILILLTIKVVRMRRRDGIVLGDNGDREVTKAIRGQANAAEQMPIALILAALVELQGGPIGPLASALGAFTLGRALHAVYFGIHGTHWRLRFYGMFLTLTGQFMLMGLLAWTVFV